MRPRSQTGVRLLQEKYGVLPWCNVLQRARDAHVYDRRVAVTLTKDKMGWVINTSGSTWLRSGMVGKRASMCQVRCT